MSILPHTTDVERRKSDVAPRTTRQVDPRPNGRFPAARAFPNAPHVRYADEKHTHVVDAWYRDTPLEPIIQKVLRSEFKSLIIVLMVMCGFFGGLFLLAMIAGIV